MKVSVALQDRSRTVLIPLTSCLGDKNAPMKFPWQRECEIYFKVSARLARFRVCVVEVWHWQNQQVLSCILPQAGPAPPHSHTPQPQSGHAAASLATSLTHYTGIQVTTQTHRCQSTPNTIAPHSQQRVQPRIIMYSREQHIPTAFAWVYMAISGRSSVGNKRISTTGTFPGIAIYLHNIFSLALLPPIHCIF